MYTLYVIHIEDLHLILYSILFIKFIIFKFDVFYNRK